MYMYINMHVYVHIYIYIHMCTYYCMIIIIRSARRSAERAKKQPGRSVTGPEKGGARKRIRSRSRREVTCWSLQQGRFWVILK